MEADTTTEHVDATDLAEASSADPSGVATGRRRVAQLVTTGAVGLALVGAWAAREWLGPERLWGLVAVLAVAAGCTWWPARAPEWWPTHADAQGAPAWLAPVLLAGCLLVMADGLRPLRGGQDRPFHEVAGDAVEGSLWGRASGADLAPLVSYAGVAMVAVALAAAVAAVRRRQRGGPERARADLRVAGGWLAAGVLVAVAAAVPARVITDRVIEADSLAHDLGQPAIELDDDLGPVPVPVSADGQLWSSALGGSSWGSPFTARVTAVEGWDVLVGFDADSTAVVAVSLADGTQRWRWARRDARLDAITVDSAAGRVLVLDGPSAVVLDLADGRELAVHRLPFPLGPTGSWLVGPDTTDRHAITTGPAAVIVDHPHLAVIDVATGQTLARHRSACEHPNYATAPAGDDGTLILEWADTDPATCANPRLLHPTGSGSLDALAELPTPTGQAGARGCTSYRDCAAMTPVDGGVALLAQWARTEDDTNLDTHLEALVIDNNGKVRWRTPTNLVGAGELHLAAHDNTLAVAAGIHLALHDLTTGQPQARATTPAPIHDAAVAPNAVIATSGNGQVHRWTIPALDPEPLAGDPTTTGTQVDVAAGGLVIGHGAGGTTVYASPANR